MTIKNATDSALMQSRSFDFEDMYGNYLATLLMIPQAIFLPELPEG